MTRTVDRGPARGKAGAYRERVSFPRSGQAGKPIVLEGERGADGEWPSLFDPSEPLIGWEPTTDADFQGASGHGVYKLPPKRFHGCSGWREIDAPGPAPWAP